MCDNHTKSLHYNASSINIIIDIMCYSELVYNIPIYNIVNSNIIDNL